MEKELHVRQDDGEDWIILENEKVINRFVRKQEARAAARALLRQGRGGVAVIHSPSGNIQEKIVVRRDVVEHAI